MSSLITSFKPASKIPTQISHKTSSEIKGNVNLSKKSGLYTDVVPNNRNNVSFKRHSARIVSNGSKISKKEDRCTTATYSPFQKVAKRKPPSDRYISRPCLKSGLIKLNLNTREVEPDSYIGHTTSTQHSDTNLSCKSIPDTNVRYKASIAKACGYDITETRILQFQPPAPQSSRSIDYKYSLMGQYCSTRIDLPCVANKKRRISRYPFRILDAPGIIDDYYLNLLSWSRENQIAIALENSVYIWDATTSKTLGLIENPLTNSYISSLRWSQDGGLLSIANCDGDIQIWDVGVRKKLRTMKGHTTRVGSMSWNKHILSSGARDGSIWNHDVRIPEHKISELNHHHSEICGLEWREDGGQLASGGNDNVVNIWDNRNFDLPQISKNTHTAAVKALSWSPRQNNLLATGGGTGDSNIHFWNTATGSRINSINTGSQVTSIRWSTEYQEFASTHGYPDNKLMVWSYPSMLKIFETVAHDSRVLHSSLSPDGSVLSTLAAEENLKFWKLFENKNKRKVMRGRNDGVNGEIATTSLR